jgi:hypothetical protein
VRYVDTDPIVLDLVEPGVVPVGAWRPDQEGEVEPLDIYARCRPQTLIWSALRHE